MIGLLIPTLVENISTRKDRSVKIVLGTQELSPAKAGELFDLMNKLAVTYICPKDISTSDIEQVDKMDVDLPTKSHSQRMRNVMYLLWKQDAEGYKDFDSYYQARMEKLIEHFKSKIEQ